jgi:hypothetical protein
MPSRQPGKYPLGQEAEDSVIIYCRHGNPAGIR